MLLFTDCCSVYRAIKPMLIERGAARCVRGAVCFTLWPVYFIACDRSLRDVLRQ